MCWPMPWSGGYGFSFFVRQIWQDTLADVAILCRNGNDFAKRQSTAWQDAGGQSLLAEFGRCSIHIIIAWQFDFARRSWRGLFRRGEFRQGSLVSALKRGQVSL